MEAICPVDLLFSGLTNNVHLDWWMWISVDFQANESRNAAEKGVHENAANILSKELETLYYKCNRCSRKPFNESNGLKLNCGI
jgi:hypothetical protein